MELQVGGLKIEFVKVGDRFSHKLTVERDGLWSTILESIEGTDEENWPASPPLQQIVAEPIGKDGRLVLLGVGLSGTGHWSISVDENGSGGLLLDVACRVSGEHGFLGSTWRLSRDWHVSQQEKPCKVGDLILRSNDDRQSIEVSSVHGDLDYENADVTSSSVTLIHAPETRVISKPTGWDLYPKPQRWAVRCRVVA
ncbi:MAG: hypothetical protein ACK5PB_22880 [Pirellula sp.]|jgi:hypothetical protein